MKKFLLLITLIGFTTNLFAQKELTYKQKAAELQKLIWGTKTPAFANNQVPADLANESAVIIARSFDMQRSSNGRIKYMIITAASVTRAVTNTTFREKVKINDKAALEKFSTIEYNKKIDKTKSYGLMKIANSFSTYIGIKITKPDGTEQIVNPDEEVLLKNDVKDQQGKLAVAGLQVGDIIDYYINTSSISEDMEQINNDNTYFFYLADEYPILDYHLVFQFNKKTTLSYLSANGAPEFVKTTNADDDQILTLDMKNISKKKSQLWASSARQFPYITLKGYYSSKYNNALMGVKTGKQDDRLSKLDQTINFMKDYSFNEVTNPIYTDPLDLLKKYFGNKKALKAAPVDSVAKVLYEAWRYSIFTSYDGKEVNMSEYKYNRAKSIFNTINMSRILTELDIDYEILIVGSRNSNTLANYFDDGDFDALIRIYGSKPLYMCFDDMVTHFNEIPAKFQGEEAITLRPKRQNAKNYSFTQGKSSIPISVAKENLLDLKLNVSLLVENMQKVKIERTVKETGSMRHDDQLKFLLVDELDNLFTAKFDGQNYTKRLSTSFSKKVARDYQAAFDQVRSEMKTQFTSEIHGEYDQEPQQLTDYKITNAALESTNPTFEYTGTFVVDNLVKKAGGNYILEVGKLIGNTYKLEDDARERKIDVYMSAARTVKYTVNFSIPKGYKLTGMEELTISKKNQAGSYTSTGSISNKILTINIERRYEHNFEKATDWPLLVELLDAAQLFNSKKVLIEHE